MTSNHDKVFTSLIIKGMQRKKIDIFTNVREFFLKKKTRVPTFTITIQHSFGSFGHSNQNRKRNKRNPNWKRRSKALTVCR